MKKQVKIGLGAAALALAAALCAGGTLAGWRTSSTVTNHISTATVQGIVEEKYEQGQTITPGQTVEKCVWVKNTGTASSLVRAKVVIDWDDETAADMDATDCVFPAYNTADWTQGEDGYWYYNDIVEPNQLVNYIWNVSFYPHILCPLWASSEYCPLGLLPCDIALSFWGVIFTEIPQAMSIMACCIGYFNTVGR